MHTIECTNMHVTEKETVTWYCFGPDCNISTTIGDIHELPWNLVQISLLFRGLILMTGDPLIFRLAPPGGAGGSRQFQGESHQMGVRRYGVSYYISYQNKIM